MREPLTVEELVKWMTDNCYNDSYGINGRNIHEGYGLDCSENLWAWYYTERGRKEILEEFQTENEAVSYAFKTIKADKFADRHLVGFIEDSLKESELITELKSRSINFWKDKIPYDGLNNFRIRVFVFGCDIKKVLDLQQKFTEL